MYKKDNRIVATLDAGGTNFVFGAMKAGEFIIEPVSVPAQSHDLDLCLQNMVNGFRQVFDQLEEKPVAISFAFPGPADYPNGIIGGYLPNFPSFREGVALGAEVYPTVVKARVDRRVFLDGKRVRDGFDADRGGNDLHSAHFYVFVSDALALDGNDRVDGELIYDSGKLFVAFLFNVDLNLTRHITDNEERACLFVAAIFNETGDLYLLARLNVGNKCSFHFLTLSWLVGFYIHYNNSTNGNKSQEET